MILEAWTAPVTSGKETPQTRVVVALLGTCSKYAREAAELLNAHGVHFELRLGQFEAHWIAFSTVARTPTPRRSATLLPIPVQLGTDALVNAASNDATAGCLLLEAPHAPELARTALGILRQHPSFANKRALLAVASSRVRGLKPDWGFADFIIHPYRPEELHQRLHALQKLARPVHLPTLANVSVNFAAHEVLVAGKPISLTHKEFQLLRCLLERQGHVLSRQQLVDRVWGQDYEGSRRTVDTHIRRLRSKLGEEFPLVTVRGAGYRVQSDTARA